MTQHDTARPSALGDEGAAIACPTCDALHRVPAGAGRTRCVRCGHRLTLGKPEAAARVVGLALTSAILMIVVLFAPFLHLSAGPFGSAASVVDVVMGLNTGLMAPLAAAVLVFIVVLPLARAALVVYALAPLVAARPNAPGAAWALRWAFVLKPWAMAEIFMLGVGVALIKLVGMASVGMGPAFWAFALFVLVAAFKDTHMCRHALWTALDANRDDAASAAPLAPDRGVAA